MQSRSIALWIVALTPWSFVHGAAVHGAHVHADHDASTHRHNKLSRRQLRDIKETEVVSPTLVQHTSPPTGPPMPRPPPIAQQPQQQNSLELQQQQQQSNAVVFACTPPQIMGICTTLDATKPSIDECIDVGEPCGEYGLAGEHCCVDLCGRKYCTAKGWFTGNNNIEVVPMDVAGVLTEDDDDENVVEIDLNIDGNDDTMITTDEPSFSPMEMSDEKNEGLYLVVPLPNNELTTHELDIDITDDVLGDDDDGYEDDDIPPLVLGQVADEPTFVPTFTPTIEPSFAPNNNVQRTVTPTIGLTREGGITDSPTSISTSIPTEGLETDFPTLPPAPFFFTEPTESPTELTDGPTIFIGDMGDLPSGVSGYSSDYSTKYSSDYSRISRSSWGSSSSSSHSSRPWYSKSRKSGKKRKRHGKHSKNSSWSGSSSSSHTDQSWYRTKSRKSGKKRKRHGKQKNSSWSSSSSSSSDSDRSWYSGSGTSWSSGESSSSWSSGRPSWSSGSSGSSSWSSGSSNSGKSSKSKSGKSKR